MKKLYTIPNIGVAGFAGSGSVIVKVADWWMGGCEGDPPDAGKDNDEDSCDGLLCTRNGVYLLIGGVNPIQIHSDYISIGSGSAWALSAMDFGKNAKEAVEHAIKHDIYSSGDVDCVYCPNYFKQSKTPKTRKKGKKK